MTELAWDDQRPATRADIDELAQATSNAFVSVEGQITVIKTKLNSLSDDVATLKSDVAQVKRVQESILTVVQSIDGRFKEISDHTERIERLEDTVFAGRSRKG